MNTPIDDLFNAIGQPEGNPPRLIDANGNPLPSATPTASEAPAVQVLNTGMKVPNGSSPAEALALLIKAMDAMIAADINLNEVAKQYPDEASLDAGGMEAMQRALGRSSACHIDLKNCYGQLRPFLLTQCEPSSPSA